MDKGEVETSSCFPLLFLSSCHMLKHLGKEKQSLKQASRSHFALNNMCSRLLSADQIFVDGCRLKVGQMLRDQTCGPWKPQNKTSLWVKNTGYQKKPIGERKNVSQNLRKPLRKTLEKTITLRKTIEKMYPATCFSPGFSPFDPPPLLPQLPLGPPSRTAELRGVRSFRDPHDLPVGLKFPMEANLFNGFWVFFVFEWCFLFFLCLSGAFVCFFLTFEHLLEGFGQVLNLVVYFSW